MSSTLLLTTDEALEAAQDILRDGLPPYAFGDWLRACLDHACTEFDRRPDQVCTPSDFVGSCIDSVLGLLRCEDEALRTAVQPLCHWGTQECLRMMKRVAYRYRSRLARRPYGPERCGELPYRDAEHGPLRVLDATPQSRPSHTGRVFSYAQVEPFVDHRVRQRVRAAQYHRRLQARRMGAEDLKSPDERGLIGQWGVFATAAIPEGDCVGVYGGQLLRKPQAELLQDREHVLWMPSLEEPDSPRVWVNGDNIMSLVNTFMSFDEQGCFAGHPEADYNVEPARFPARLAHGWQAGVVALFALRDIAPGEELRWNYRWHCAPTRPLN